MVLFTINVVFEKIVRHLSQSTNITYLKCLRLKFMILIVDLEIEIARWIYDYLNISSCKHFQSVLFFFLNIFCIKLAYLLTTSLTLQLRLKIFFLKIVIPLLTASSTLQSLKLRLQNVFTTV